MSTAPIIKAGWVHLYGHVFADKLVARAGRLGAVKITLNRAIFTRPEMNYIAKIDEHIHLNFFRPCFKLGARFNRWQYYWRQEVISSEALKSIQPLGLLLSATLNRRPA
jgi:hypothetical protein